MNLKSKYALVTGGSRGIGKAIVRELAARGAEVVFSYKNQETAAKGFVSELKEAGVIVKALQMDVASRQSIKKVFTQLTSMWPKLDILVNNAGVNNPTDFDKITDADWDWVLNINLRGPFICTQEAVPLLTKSGHASVINIGSVSGQYGGPRTAHYAASKAGLISLGQVIARFGATNNIRCNTVAAGLIASKMGAKGLQAGAVATAAESILLKRLGTAEEVAQVVAFLASDESSYITAQTINVNGGLYF